jgi:hypothetical protein
MMEAVRTSETSANFNATTRRCTSEDSKLYTRRHANLKSHNIEMDLKETQSENLECITHITT